MSDSCFELEGWDEFVERFSQFVDKWEAKKAQLLKKMGNIYHSEVKQREKARAEAKRQKKEKHDFYSLLRMTDQVCR